MPHQIGTDNNPSTPSLLPQHIHNFTEQSTELSLKKSKTTLTMDVNPPLDKETNRPNHIDLSLMINTCIPNHVKKRPPLTNLDIISTWSNYTIFPGYDPNAIMLLLTPPQLQQAQDQFSMTSLDNSVSSNSVSSNEKKHQDRINTSIVDNSTSFNDEQQQFIQDSGSNTSCGTVSYEHDSKLANEYLDHYTVYTPHSHHFDYDSDSNDSNSSLPHLIWDHFVEYASADTSEYSSEDEHPN